MCRYYYYSDQDGSVRQYGTFLGCTITAYYPQSNTTWTKEVREANYKIRFKEKELLPRVAKAP